MSEYTKGPWRVEHRYKWPNAILVAAAPDLLEAAKLVLVDLQQNIDDIGPCDHAVNICVCGLKSNRDTLLAAIAKAEGK